MIWGENPLFLETSIWIAAATVFDHDVAWVSHGAPQARCTIKDAMLMWHWGEAIDSASGQGDVVRNDHHHVAMGCNMIQKCVLLMTELKLMHIQCRC